ncbi:hypothetical protein DFH07DRAFT_779300 [Mycena maculata]|uniref:Uncharacterized protein n=1 Tax=Mycena maculata TaxID=230809 RepID=A0AAD7I8R9_9AGAR|nr:hypothetical protein DFH07DRAFT_779300 [Mycena maculata]
MARRNPLQSSGPTSANKALCLVAHGWHPREQRSLIRMDMGTPAGVFGLTRTHTRKNRTHVWVGSKTRTGYLRVPKPVGFGFVLGRVRSREIVPAPKPSSQSPGLTKPSQAVLGAWTGLWLWLEVSEAKAGASSRGFECCIHTALWSSVKSTETDLHLPLSTSVYPLSTWVDICLPWRVDTCRQPSATSVYLSLPGYTDSVHPCQANLGSPRPVFTPDYVYLGLPRSQGRHRKTGSVYPVSTLVDRPSVYWKLERSDHLSNSIPIIKARLSVEVFSLSDGSI